MDLEFCGKVGTEIWGKDDFVCHNGIGWDMDGRIMRF